MVQQMIDAKMSLPVVAGILEAAVAKQGAFVDEIRDALYRDFPFKNVIKHAQEHPRLVDYVHGNPGARRIPRCGPWPGCAR